jgi:hypothetical protein
MKLKVEILKIGEGNRKAHPLQKSQRVGHPVFYQLRLGEALSICFMIEMSLMAGLLRGLVASSFLALVSRLVDFLVFMACPFFLKSPGGMRIYTPTFPRPQGPGASQYLAAV